MDLAQAVPGPVVSRVQLHRLPVRLCAAGSNLQCAHSIAGVLSTTSAAQVQGDVMQVRQEPIAVCDHNNGKTLCAPMAAGGFFISTYSWPMRVQALRYVRSSLSARRKYITACASVFLPTHAVGSITS